MAPIRKTKVDFRLIERSGPRLVFTTCLIGDLKTESSKQYFYKNVVYNPVSRWERVIFAEGDYFAEYHIFTLNLAACTSFLGCLLTLIM